MVLSSCFSLALGGCLGAAAVRGDRRLPVRNVVLYRSGVGYFERAGTFRGDSIAFGVKQSEVGDFLASLTAVERGADRVRSVSFEVPVEARARARERADVEAPKPPRGHRELDEHEEEAPAPAPLEPRVDVKLAFGGSGAHALEVAYVVGSPIWRPSYRVVFDQSDQALLQAWAVVQNTSGEDWRDVKLALTTGAPISFRSDLGTPITPLRPLVSDRGEVVEAVPVGETVVNQQAAGSALAPEAPPAPAPAPAEAMADQAEREEFAAAKPAPESAKRRARTAQGAALPLALDARALENSVRAQASTTVLTESVTRYDVDERVTIPDGGSTMVALVSTRVPGERAHLFAPEPGVPISQQHPFAVARLRNATGAVLEKGPISVLAEGAFLGQGLLDTLPRQAQAFVPFALDKSIVVEPSERYDEQQGQLLRVTRGLVTVQRFSQRKTLYRFRNGGAAVTKLYVRHGRWGDAELVAPPQGTELAPDKALLPVSLPAHGQTQLEVVERTPVTLELTIMDPRAAEAIALWLSGPAASDPQSAELKRALELQQQLGELDRRIGASEGERNEVDVAAAETRKNLKAIEKLGSAQDLRARLVQRLKQLDARSAELTQSLIEARTQRSELEVRLQEAIAHIDLTPKA